MEEKAKKKNIIGIVIAVVLLICLLSYMIFGIKTSAYLHYPMGTYLQQSLTGRFTNGTSEDIYEDMSYIESKVGTEVIGSDIYQLNRAKAGEWLVIDQVTYELIEMSKKLFVDTDGAFNIAMYPLVKLWQFSPDTFVQDSTTFKPPTDEEVAELMQYAHLDNILLENKDNTYKVCRTNDKTEIDLGGIAKGYAVSRTYDILEDKTKSAWVNLGGNVVSYGKDFWMGIRDPRYIDHEMDVLGRVILNNGTLSTSGDYEKYYMYEEVRYSHILDRAGYPVGIACDNTSCEHAHSESDIISVTILSPSDLGALCDAMSTAVFVLGSVEGAKLLEEQGLSAIIITKDMKLSLVGDIEYEMNPDNNFYTMV